MRLPDSVSSAATQFRRAPLWWQCALVATAGFAVWLLTAPTKTSGMRLFTIAFLAVLNFVGAAAFAQAARRPALSRRVRQALGCFAAGLTMVGLGATYLGLEVALVTNYQSTFSVADGLFLLSYPLMLAGLTRLPRGERPAAGRWRIALDGLACVVGVGVPLWLGAVGPAWHENTGMDAVLVLLWPCVAFVGLMALNGALLTRAPVPTRGALWWLLGSLGISWLADLIFSLDASAMVIRNSAIHWTNLTNAVALGCGLVAARRFAADPLPASPRLRPAAFSPVPMVTMMIVAAWLVVLGTAAAADPQMLRRTLPGLVMLLLVLLVRELLVMADTVHWMAAEFEHEGEARLVAMVRQSSDVMMIVDPQNQVRFASPSLTAVLGRPVEAVVGRSLLELVHAEDVAAGARFLQRLAEQPGAVAHLRWRLRHADGTTRQFETAGSNALLEPAVSGLVLNSRDVTDHLQLEEELRESQKLEAISRLVGGIAHNFNNALASTLLGLGLMRNEKQLPPEVAREFAALEQGAKRTAELIQQLQSFGQVQFLRRQRLDLGEVLTRLHPVLARMLGDRIRLELAGTGEPAWIRADGALMNQVVLNLVANARDAMPEGGQLVLAITSGPADPPAGGAVARGREVCLSCRDTGRGMDESVRQHLFEPFFTTKGTGQGVGLGLAVVHGIVRQHAGRLSVESEVGRGSTFRVYLPEATDA